MNKNDLITKIKTQLKKMITNKFAEVKAGDLMITSQDEVLVVGSEVFTLDQDGNNVPLADGEYILDSGIKIEVVGGKIAEMAEKEAEVEQELAVVEDPTKQDVPAVPAAEETKPDLSEEMKKMNERLAKCEMMIEKMMKEKTEMEFKITKLSEIPSTSGIEVKATEFKSISEKKNDSMIDISSIREKIRKNNR